MIYNDWKPYQTKLKLNIRLEFRNNTIILENTSESICIQIIVLIFQSVGYFHLLGISSSCSLMSFNSLELGTRLTVSPLDSRISSIFLIPFSVKSGHQPKLSVSWRKKRLNFNFTEKTYRIRLIAAPLLNRAPGNLKSPIFGLFLE